MLRRWCWPDLHIEYCVAADIEFDYASLLFSASIAPADGNLELSSAGRSPTHCSRNIAADSERFNYSDVG